MGAGSLQRRTSSLFVSLFLPSYYIRNNETQYPTGNGRKGSGRKGEKRRPGVPSVSSRWAESLVQQWQLPFYQSAPVAILLNTPESIINSRVVSLSSSLPFANFSHDEVRWRKRGWDGSRHEFERSDGTTINQINSRKFRDFSNPPSLGAVTTILRSWLDGNGAKKKSRRGQTFARFEICAGKWKTLPLVEVTSLSLRHNYRFLTQTTFINIVNVRKNIMLKNIFQVTWKK